MSKDIKAILTQKLAENNRRHQSAQQETQLLFGNSFKRLEISKIRPNPYQPRTEFLEEELQTLSQSIEQVGLIQPISVREVDESTTGFAYEIIAGERRFRAMQSLGKTTIDAIIMTLPDDELAILALAENMERQDLSDYEIGLALRQIENLFPNKTKLAEAVGLNRQDMYRYFAYEELPQAFLAELIKRPRLLSRAAAEQIKKVINEYQLSETDASRILLQAWDLLNKGNLEQTKIANFIKQQLQPNTNKVVQGVPFLVDDKEIGSLKHKGKKLVLELDTAYLQENDELKIQSFVQKLLTNRLL